MNIPLCFKEVVNTYKIVLPLFTYDRRNVVVYLLPCRDFVILHDAGKTLAEFWGQGFDWKADPKAHSYLRKILIQYNLLLGDSQLGEDTLIKKVPIDALSLEIWSFGSALVAISSLLYLKEG